MTMYEFAVSACAQGCSQIFAVVVLQSVTQQEGRNDKTDHSWVARLHAPHNVSMPRTTARAVLHTHGTNTAVCKRMPAYHKAHLQE